MKVVGLFSAILAVVCWFMARLHPANVSNFKANSSWPVLHIGVDYYRGDVVSLAIFFAVVAIALFIWG